MRTAADFVALTKRAGRLGFHLLHLLSKIANAKNIIASDSNSSTTSIIYDTPRLAATCRRRLGV